MKACVKAAGEGLPLVRAPTGRALARSFVKVSRLPSPRTKSQVSCSFKVSENAAHRIEATAENIFPATKDHVTKATYAINRGKVIAVPTDTIYGFACDACSAGAVNRIYEIKGRIQTRPLAICVADVSDISRFALVDHLPHGLLDSLLPGPVTVVLKRGENSILERSLNPGLDSIGVRVPDQDFIRSIARGAGSALALTSANLSGQPSSVSIKDFEDLWPHCSFVFDGGILPSGRDGSTIVDLITPGVYKILRDGSFVTTWCFEKSQHDQRVPFLCIVDHLPHGLLDSLLPGPVTVVLKRGENSILERSLNPGLDSIGVRVPDQDFIRSIARGAGSALALTSANLSGQPSSVSIKDFEDLWPHCSFVFDGGILPSGRDGSTIVDLITPGVYKILRDGSSRDETAAVLGKFGFVEAL